MEASAEELSPRVRWIWGCLMGLTAFVLGPLCLNLEHFGHWHSQTTELFVWIAGIIIGVCGLWLLPLRTFVRLLLTLPYIVLAVFTTFVHGAMAGCAFFGDCL